MGPSSGTAEPVAPIGVAVALLLGAGFILIAARRRRRTRNAAPEAVAVVGSPATTDPSPVVQARPPSGEEHLPRWRRPSVTAARFETANTVAVRTAMAATVAAPRTPIVFEDRVDGAERMVIRFDGVPLLDRPDDALGRTRGELDTGDEVAVLERDEEWANVTTPTGHAGWVPAMALTAVPPDGVDAGKSPPLPEPESAPNDSRPALETLLAAIAAARRERDAVASGGESVPAFDAEPEEHFGARGHRHRGRRRKSRSGTHSG